MEEKVSGRILLVEDSDEVRALHSAILEEAGFRTAGAATLTEARSTISDRPFDAVVIDLSLPDGNGMSLVPRLRELSKVGIIIVTSSRDLRDRYDGLEQGADDYLVKPVHPRELVARIKNLLLRLKQRKLVPEKTYLPFKGWAIDLVARHVNFDDGAREKLTDTDFRIMEVLIRNAGTPVKREEIHAALSESEESSARAVDKAIYRLRLKFQIHLGTAVKVIETVHGLGYRLISKSM